MTERITPELAALMREAQAHFEQTSRHAPARVTATARRRRRRSSALLSGGVVVAALALVAAGIGASGGSGGSATQPSFSPLPSASPAEDLSVPIASATIPIDGGPGYDGVEALLECGAAAPEPTGTVDNFAVSFNSSQPLAITADQLITGQTEFVQTTTTYSGTDTVPTALTPVYLLLVKDGVVQGSFLPDNSSAQFWTFDNTQASESGGDLMPFGRFCPEVGKEITPNSEWRVLEPGNYQVMPVVRVWADQEVAALRYLVKSGIEVFEYPPEVPSGYLTPGSWDCKQLSPAGPTTRACLGDVTGNAIVDVDAGTVTLPFEPSQLTRDVDVTLVGDPVDLTIDEPITVPEFQSNQAKAVNVDDTLECGTTLDYVESAAPVHISGSIYAMFKGGANSNNTQILTDDPGSGTVTLGQGSKAWVVGGSTVNYEYFEDHPGNLEIIGVADVSIAGGNTVDYDRYSGPTRVDLVFRNVTWCDGSDPNSNINSAIIDATVSVAPDGQKASDPSRVLIPFEESIDQY